jgi:hypothetical protein
MPGYFPGINRRLKSKFHRAYFKYLVFPQIAPGEKVKDIIRIKKAYNVTHILTRNFFYKVASGSSNTLELEFNNYNYVKTGYPGIGQYIPDYSYRKGRRFSFLKLEKLSEIINDAENQEAALEVLNRMKEYGLKHIVKIQELQAIAFGLGLVKKTLPSDKYEELYGVINSFLTHNPVRLGPSHYDFHLKNILKNYRGEVKVIDFDCFTSAGIQAIDELYYHVEKQAIRKGYPWFPYVYEYCMLDHANISRYVNWDGDRRILGILYFLNRIGQENALFNIVYSDAEILKIITLL